MCIRDSFLNRAAALCPSIPIVIIAGNHDSPERLNYASSFMEKHQIYISVMPPQRTDEYLKKVVLEDDYGLVNIYLLPFTKPGYVRPLFPDRDIPDYETAVRAVLERETVSYTHLDVYKRQHYEYLTEYPGYYVGIC